MKIHVHDPKGNHHINLWIPNSFIFSHIGIQLATYAVNKNQDTLDSQLFKHFLKQAKHILKQYKGLEIVDVQSKNGENVKITL